MQNVFREAFCFEGLLFTLQQAEKLLAFSEVLVQSQEEVFVLASVLCLLMQLLAVFSEL